MGAARATTTRPSDAPEGTHGHAKAELDGLVDGVGVNAQVYQHARSLPAHKMNQSEVHPYFVQEPHTSHP